VLREFERGISATCLLDHEQYDVSLVKLMMSYLCIKSLQRLSGGRPSSGSAFNTGPVAAVIHAIETVLSPLPLILSPLQFVHASSLTF